MLGPPETLTGVKRALRWFLLNAAPGLFSRVVPVSYTHLTLPTIYSV